MTATPSLGLTALPRQGTFDELGTPLRDVTFVVVDLETTGGSPATSAITEVGAVKVRSGEVLGEFQTLVNPGVAIPPFIAVLTGITDPMVANAPDISTVLPSFLEFARGSVLVAHNAPFDLGFLRAACTETERAWPGYSSLDTARLARRVLTRDEAPDCRLATLARIFRSPTTPEHRALADARATVHVLHQLLERVGNLGVQSLEELATFSSQVSPEVRRKRHLAEGLPQAPGVYLFRDASGRPLYVGRSRNLRSRVRHYFVSSESRTRMAEMVTIAERVDAVVCATPLEAEVRELRLIAEHKPRYNRRSRFPERASWLKLTVEAFPRLSRVREVRDDGATYLGPFGSRRQAEAAMTALHETFPIRQCTQRVSEHRNTPACALAGMDRCGAPCEGHESVTAYAVHADGVRTAITGSPDAVVTALTTRIGRLAAVLRYEEAARHRDRLAAFLRATARYQRLAALGRCAQLVAARRTDDGGFELHVVRHGRLVAAGTVLPGAAPRPYVDALLATAETVTPAAGPLPCATAEEMECVLRWLDQAGVRLVELDGEWTCPTGGAERHRQLAASALDAAEPFRDRRGLRPAHRPARALKSPA
ncbi:MAG: polymerase subunit epsilon [Frankiales bacterium]|nr:polymerase subunit epsilon [Frankiales bacterium]